LKGGLTCYPLFLGLIYFPLPLDRLGLDLLIDRWRGEWSKNLSLMMAFPLQEDQEEDDDEKEDPNKLTNRDNEAAGCLDDGKRLLSRKKIKTACCLDEEE